MTETQRRIKIYKQALPHLKERVTAVAILLAISVSMMASASFAWLTLSVAPEVNGLATTVSTNGNLEIALSGVKGKKPNESTATDGAGTITETNLTWGNLINLSDESYGLDYLTLRPATLETGKLLTSPLKSVTYGEDGRISGTISDFAYTNFEITESGGKAFFVPDDGIKYGVRAISSVTYGTVKGDAMLISLANSVETNRVRAEVKFKQMYNNPDYMNAITGLAGVYLTYRDVDVDQDVTQYVEPVYYMIQDYITCLDYIGQSLLSAANLHHFVYCNQNPDKATYTAFTLDDIKDGTAQSVLSAEGVTLNAMALYRKSVTEFYGNGTVAKPGVYAPIKAAYENKRYMGWEEMRNYVNIMANIYTTTVNGTEAQSIGADAIKSMIGGSPKAVIKTGLIVDMEKMLGTGLQVSGLRMAGTLRGVSFDLRCSVTTAVTAPYYLVEDALDAQAKAAAGGLIASDAVAADTYGMALDFWLRTNAANSKLKLEGELIYETRDKMGPDGQPELDTNGNVIKERVVVGYSGANRIWDENDPGLPETGTSTSQGTGSCYVFYPSTDADRIQSLNLLRAMCIAFVSKDGTLLAQADLDTNNAIQNYGRVLVPLQIREEILTTIDPETNEEVEVKKNYITDMVQNEATRVTALVYLDGSMLTNSEVLSASSINGHLNIQFCTDEDLSSIDRPELKDDYYKVNISAAGADTEGVVKFDTFNPNNKPKVKLTLELDGMEADTITGNFVSYISQTQGARQPTFSFTHKGGMIWEAEVTFQSAGNFELRSVQIDGVDCLIAEDQVVRVEIKGVAVSNVICPTWTNPSSFKLMTANTYYPLSMEMNLSIGEGMRTPTEVLAVFTHSGGQNVTLSFTPRSNTVWTAKGNFTASGNYTLNYVIIDNAIVALTGTQIKTLDLTLGVKVRTFLKQPVNEAYLALEEEMNAALEAAGEGEYEDIKTEYEARLAELLNTLYEGDPNDDRDSLELVSTPSGYRFYHDGSESLFMDVSCVVVNDKNQPITELIGTWIYYGIGDNTQGRLGSRMSWNPSTQSYEGCLEITGPGTYTFQTLDIPVSGGEPMHITSSPNAPKIQAASPTPITYVGKSDINSTDSLVNITPNANRWIGFVLGDAASAEAVMTVRHTAAAANMQAYRTALNLPETAVIVDNGNGTYSYDLTVEAQKVNDEDEDDYFFFVDVPNDGTWKIVDMQIYSAFYGDTFYDGVPVEEGGTGYLTPALLGLDLNGQDKIESNFFTTVKFDVSTKLPTMGNNMEFMEPYYNKAVTFKVTDYMGKSISGVGVHLSYTWDGNLQKGYTASGTIKNEWKVLGGDLTAAADGSFTTPVLAFRLSGSYACDFRVTYNGEEYDISKFTMTDDEFVAGDVMVSWVLPELKITALSKAKKDVVNNSETFAVNLANDLDLDGISQVNRPLSGVQNYFEDHYANSYIMGTLGGYSVPNLKMQLTKAGETGEVIVVVGQGGSSNHQVDFKFSGSGDDDEQEIGSVSGGELNLGFTVISTFNRARSGTTKLTTVNLNYGGVTFKAELDEAVTIRQDATPMYATLNYDSEKLGAINEIDATAYDNAGVVAKPFTAAGTRNSIVVISPTGNAFDITLPGASHMIPRAEDGENVTEIPDEVGAKSGKQVYVEQNGSCNSKTYNIYDVWERTVYVSGTKLHYEDTFSIKKWSNGNVGDSVKISSNVTITAEINTSTAGPVTEKLTAEPRTQKKYVHVSNGNANPPAGGTKVEQTDITNYQQYGY